MSPIAVATPATSTPSTSGAAGVLAFARAQLGKPYKWGATGPDAYDCSGLVQSAYKAIGQNLPRTTAQLISVGSAVAKADLQPGDLVFPNVGHVQIYSGGGNVVEAPNASKPVREVPMWGFLTARRVLGAESGTGVAGAAGSALGGLVGAVKDGASAVPGVSEVATLASALNPAKWGEEFGKIGLRLAVVGAGLGLVLLGSSRLVAGATQNLYDDAKELL